MGVSRKTVQLFRAGAASHASHIFADARAAGVKMRRLVFPERLGPVPKVPWPVMSGYRQDYPSTRFRILF